MKTKLTIILAVLFALSTPFAVMGMSHEKGEQKKMDKMEHKGHGGQDDHGMHEGDDHSGHGKMEGHGSMDMKGDMRMLGDDTDAGVKAMAHLKDVQEAMAAMDMAETHHFMVMFMDTETGEPIEEGTVALKIEQPNGQEVGPVRLMGMQGHFGADIRLLDKGEYTFKVGTRLADGEKRQYEFTHNAK